MLKIIKKIINFTCGWIFSMGLKEEIEYFIRCTCGWIFSISLAIFFSTYWLFNYNEIQDSIKESLTITLSAFSALTTIGAAIIAAKMFVDWKEEFYFREGVELQKKSLKELNQLKREFFLLKNNYNLLDEMEKNDFIWDDFQFKFYAKIENTKKLIESLKSDIEDCTETLEIKYHDFLICINPLQKALGILLKIPKVHRTYDPLFLDKSLTWEKIDNNDIDNQVKEDLAYYDDVWDNVTIEYSPSSSSLVSVTHEFMKYINQTKLIIKTFKLPQDQIMDKVKTIIKD